MRDLVGESEASVARERSRVALEGWGARLLDLQATDGHWGGAAFVPRAWISTKDTLQLLRDLGVDPTSDRVRRAVALVRDRCTWGAAFGDAPFFDGEVEPCINGRVLAIGGYFGEPRDRLADRNDVIDLGRDAGENAIALRLDLDDRLVGLDLEEHVALLDRLPFFLQPRDELARLLRHLERRHHH
jgi:hypothetical protein